MALRAAAPYGLTEAPQTVGPDQPDRGRRDEDVSDDNPITNIIRKVLTTKGQKPRKRETRVVEPAQQIAPTSYLGRVLGRVEKQAHPDSHSDSSNSSSESESDSDGSFSPSSNDSDSSDSSSSTQTSETSLSSEKHRRRRKRHKVSRRESRKQRKRFRSKAKKRTKKSMAGYGKLKPIPPTKYDGSRIHARITGKAHGFYTREASSDPYRWNIHDFLLELFNNCVPVDFRTKQRAKLSECLQRQRTVREYVAELYELWNPIGDVSEREK